MQLRLKDLEQQLELAKSASASRASEHSRTISADSETRNDEGTRLRNASGPRGQAMSAWVKGALGEANTIVSGGRQEPSWLGLGSWVGSPSEYLLSSAS